MAIRRFPRVRRARAADPTDTARKMRTSTLSAWELAGGGGFSRGRCGGRRLGLHGFGLRRVGLARRGLWRLGLWRLGLRRLGPRRLGLWRLGLRRLAFDPFRA